MSDTITVQLSVSVDTLLTIIGGAMIVVTVVVISVVGKIIKLLILSVNIQEKFPPFSSFVCQALMCSSFGLYQDSRPAPATSSKSVEDNSGASLGKRPEVQLKGGEAAEVPGGGS